MSQFLIKKSSYEELYFSSSSAYDRPEWVTKENATSYISEDAASRARNNLLREGSYDVLVELRAPFRPTPADTELDQRIGNAELQSASPTDDEDDVDVFIRVDGDDELEVAGSEDQIDAAIEDELTDNEDQPQIEDELSAVIDALELDDAEDDEFDVEQIAARIREAHGDAEYDNYSQAQKDSKDAYRAYTNLKQNSKDEKAIAAAYQRYKDARSKAAQAAPLTRKAAANVHSRFDREQRNGTADIKLALKDSNNKLYENERIPNDGERPDNKAQSLTTTNIPKVDKLKLADPAQVSAEDTSGGVELPADSYDKIKVPANVIADLKKLARDYSVDDPDNVTASFNLTMVGAVEEILSALADGTAEGYKLAQVRYASYMSALTDKFPESAKQFLLNGGARRKLKDVYDDKYKNNKKVSVVSEDVDQQKFLAVQKAYTDRTENRIKLDGAKDAKEPDQAKIAQLQAAVDKAQRIIDTYENGKRAVKESEIGLAPGWYFAKNNVIFTKRPMATESIAYNSLKALPESEQLNIQIKEVSEVVVEDGSELSKLKNKLANLERAKQALSKPTNQSEYDAYDDILQDIKNIKAKIASCNK